MGVALTIPVECRIEYFDIVPKGPILRGEKLSSSTDLRGELTQTSSLADSLHSLILSDNRLGDECFDEISFLVGLKTLNLSYNDLIEIPQGCICRLTRLNELYLSGNELSTLPGEDLEALKSLKLLYLNNNKLVTLPAELSKLANLQHLDVSSNQLKYNIANWPYDWNWHWNKNLRYLNFSGNKRFEIKQSHIKNPETGEDFDSLLVLKQLKVLGLIDVTLTTTNVPEQSIDLRLRTTASEFDNFGYGVSDSLGMRDHVSTRDLFVQKFRGNENEVLLCSFDGKHGAPNQGHRISLVSKNIFVNNFTKELDEIKSDDEIENALRKAFLAFNKEINGILSSKKNNAFTPIPKISKESLDLNLADDANAGCAVSVIYIKDKVMYSANIGDIEALLCRSNGDQFLLTTKHQPTTREEFERIRASGGYVSGQGNWTMSWQFPWCWFFNFCHIQTVPHQSTSSKLLLKTILSSWPVKSCGITSLTNRPLISFVRIRTTQWLLLKSCVILPFVMVLQTRLRLLC